MPKIKSIAQYKGNTAQIEFEDAQPLFINFDTVSKYELAAGMDIPQSAAEQIKKTDLVRKARERALYLLDMRDHSYSELVKKLRKNYDEDICFEVADELAQKGLLNDRRYARSLARQLFEVKLLGSYIVRQKMREKGLPKGVIEQAIAEYEDGAQERAAELIRRKYLQKYDPDDRADREKLIAALARKGYSYTQIKAAIELVIE